MGSESDCTAVQSVLSGREIESGIDGDQATDVLYVRDGLRAGGAMV